MHLVPPPPPPKKKIFLHNHDLNTQEKCTPVVMLIGDGTVGEGGGGYKCIMVDLEVVNNTFVECPFPSGGTNYFKTIENEL